MPTGVGFASFEKELNRLVGTFERNLAELKKPGYAEAQLRDDCGVKLRAATSESQRATLQNAVTSTDQQIDQLVYELYGLTKEEIQLVEGGQ
jgi:hypothetical protein